MIKKIFYLINLLLLIPFSVTQSQDTFGSILSISKLDSMLGNIQAPNTVIEYISPSCHHCANFHRDSFPEIKKNYIDTGKVKWVTRIFVNDAPSLKIAMLAKCNSNNESYYKLLNLYLTNQSAWITGNSLDIIENIFLLAGNSKKTFLECTSNKDLENNIIDIRKDASLILNLKGTPAFYINGKKEMFMTTSQFASLINNF